VPMGRKDHHVKDAHGADLSFRRPSEGSWSLSSVSRLFETNYAGHGAKAVDLGLQR